MVQDVQFQAFVLRRDSTKAWDDSHAWDNPSIEAMSALKANTIAQQLSQHQSHEPPTAFDVKGDNVRHSIDCLWASLGPQDQPAVNYWTLAYTRRNRAKRTQRAGLFRERDILYSKSIDVVFVRGLTDKGAPFGHHPIVVQQSGARVQPPLLTGPLRLNRVNEPYGDIRPRPHVSPQALHAPAGGATVTADVRQDMPRQRRVRRREPVQARMRPTEVPRHIQRHADADAARSADRAGASVAQNAPDRVARRPSAFPFRTQHESGRTQNAGVRGEVRGFSGETAPVQLGKGPYRQGEKLPPEIRGSTLNNVNRFDNTGAHQAPPERSQAPNPILPIDSDDEDSYTSFEDVFDDPPVSGLDTNPTTENIGVHNVAAVDSGAAPRYHDDQYHANVRDPKYIYDAQQRRQDLEYRRLRDEAIRHGREEYGQAQGAHDGRSGVRLFHETQARLRDLAPRVFVDDHFVERSRRHKGPVAGV